MISQSVPQTNSHNLITHLVTHIILHTTVITVAFLTAGVNTCQKPWTTTNRIRAKIQGKCLTLSGTHQNSNNLMWVMEHNPSNHLLQSRQMMSKKAWKCGRRLCLGLVWMCLFEENHVYSNTTVLNSLKSSFLHCFLSRKAFTSVNGKSKAFHGVLHKH